MMFQVYDDATRVRVLDEALEGKRGIGEIAEDANLGEVTVRRWLKAHYEANPDDPRRHLVLRENDPDKRESEQKELAFEGPDDGADKEAREDMPRKKKRNADGQGHKTKKGQPHPQKDRILAEFDAGGVTQAELARKYGISQTAIGYWRKSRDVGETRRAKLEKLKAAVIADLEAGYTGGTLVQRHRGKIAKTAVFRVQAEWRARQDTAQAPQARETTQLSQPASVVQSAPPSQALAVLRQPLPEGNMLRDTLAECIDERQTLRGMVRILERENEDLKRAVREYQRAYGDLRR